MIREKFDQNDDVSFNPAGMAGLRRVSAEGDSGQFTPTDAEVEQYNARVAPEDRIVCRQEKPVGTYIAKRVCRLQVDVDATSSLHRQQLRRVLN